MKLIYCITDFLKQNSKFRRYSLKVKLIIIFIIISIIPIIITQIISYKLSQHYLENKITRLSNANLQYIKTNIETDVNYYKEILYRLVVDSDCLELEHKFNDGDDFEKAASINKIRDIFGSYSYSRSQIRAITFVGKDGRNVYYDKKNQGIINRVWDIYSDTAKDKIYSDIMKSNGPVVLSTTSNNYIGEKPEYLFHIGLRVKDIVTKEEMGIIVMSFDEQVLSDICNADRENMDNDKTSICTLIIDSYGKIVSFENKKLIGTYITDFSPMKISSKDNSETLSDLAASIPSFTNKDISASTLPLSDNGWRIINIINKNSLFYEINLLKYITFGVLIIIIVIVLIIIIVFSNKFYDSVRTIVNGMSEVKKGNFDVRINLNTEDELAFIGNEFNEMTLKINNLVEDIKKQGEYILDISNKRREAEIKAIVAQINPHFLYNTLDSINWMAIREEKYEISEMLGNLADILRYSIGDINKDTSLYDEIEWLKKYIYLQQVRFNNSFALTLDINENILGYRIHKLLLQPLVENSIIHGFKGYNSGGELVVNINRFQENHLVISVKDNGNGITLEKLNEIKSNFEFRENEDKNIGIMNVYDRLKIYYRENAKLEIESIEGKGTTITMIIPVTF